MKEGSFETLLDLNFTEPRIDTDLPKTPDQVPDPFDFSHLPESALGSNAMEAVIQQNEDLMSRLSVSLRRISFLEEKIKETATQADLYRTRHENLKDQLLVMKEQAKRLANKNATTSAEQARKDDDIKELKEQIRVLEVRYAELYQNHRSSRQEYEDELIQADRVVARFAKYRQKIKQAIPKYRAEFASLKAQRAQQDSLLAGLRQNLNETTQYITEQGQNHKRDIRELTESFEIKVKGLEGENEMLVEQSRMLGERVKEFDRLQTERFRLENELVVANRREQESRAQFEAQLHETQASLGKYRTESKQLAVELKEKMQQLDSLKTQNEELRTAQQSLIEQVETLQAIWNEQQSKVENLTEQKAALQRLNQELSVTCNKQRIEIRELKEKLERH